MQTTEKIIEAYARYVKGWATIPNVRCRGGFEIDLLAIDPKTCQRYHIETSISISPGFSKLTSVEFDESNAKSVHRATMRRTIGYFIKSKFDPMPVVKTLSEYGFAPNNYKKIIATWDATEDAVAAAQGANIELWYLPRILQKIAATIEQTPSYFADDTLRTIGLYGRAIAASADAQPGS